jgi:hypothetical protein
MAVGMALSVRPVTDCERGAANGARTACAPPLPLEEAQARQMPVVLGASDASDGSQQGEAPTRLKLLQLVADAVWLSIEASTGRRFRGPRFPTTSVSSDTNSKRRGRSSRVPIPSTVRSLKRSRISCRGSAPRRSSSQSMNLARVPLSGAGESHSFQEIRSGRYRNVNAAREVLFAPLHLSSRPTRSPIEVPRSMSRALGLHDHLQYPVSDGQAPPR